jgi:uncharacterized protein
MSNSQENTQIIQNIYQAFGQGDIPTVLSYMDEQATFINKFGKGLFPGQWGKPTQGHAEILGFFKDMNEAVEVHALMPREMIAQGDKVVVLIDWKGVVKRTQKPFDSFLTHIWTLHNGKVVDYIGLSDPTAYAF